MNGLGVIVMLPGAMPVPRRVALAVPLSALQRFREKQVEVTDGTSCGFETPTRPYKGPEAHPLVPDAAVLPIKRAA